MKILYVEDNDDNVYMLKNRLSRAGFTVIVATDGTQGISMATSEQPDLILMDLKLPDVAGEEVTRRIKADPSRNAFQSLPSPRMPWPAIGKKATPQAATISIPNLWMCPACSKNRGAEASLGLSELSS
jgi:CheY-like chemotaxis protein